jgi:hypothetical protein
VGEDFLARATARSVAERAIAVSAEQLLSTLEDANFWSESRIGRARAILPAQFRQRVFSNNPTSVKKRALEAAIWL